VVARLEPCRADVDGLALDVRARGHARQGGLLARIVADQEVDIVWEGRGEGEVEIEVWGVWKGRKKKKGRRACLLFSPSRRARALLSHSFPYPSWCGP
jgi:hypothetical protein